MSGVIFRLPTSELIDIIGHLEINEKIEWFHFQTCLYQNHTPLALTWHVCSADTAQTVAVLEAEPAKPETFRGLVVSGHPYRENKIKDKTMHSDLIIGQCKPPIYQLELPGLNRFSVGT